MKTISLILACALLSGCTSTQFASNPVGAQVIAKTANSVIDKGLHAGATKIDTGNPYLHSLAVGLRANEGKILTAADIQKIATDYGDPMQKEKFKTLAWNIWGIVKNAAINIGWSAATELAAQGIQDGATVKNSETHSEVTRKIGL